MQPTRAYQLLLLTLAVAPLPSCYVNGHAIRFITRQPKETMDLPDTLGEPGLRRELDQRSAFKIKHEIWTAVRWNEHLRKTRVQGTQDQESYRLAPGDRISVQVAEEAKLSTQYYIRPDGTFSFPYLAEIEAGGKTPRQVADILHEGLMAFIKDPQVTVNLEQGAQRIVGAGGAAGPDFGDILVWGELGGGGGAAATTSGISGRIVPFSGKQNLSSVLASAGGLSGRANWRNVAVFRQENDPESESGKMAVVIVSDMSQYFKRADFEQDFPLRINDIVFVPTQPEYAGTAFQHDWNLVLSYLGGITTYDAFLRRLSDTAHIIPRATPNTEGDK